MRFHLAVVVAPLSLALAACGTAPRGEPPAPIYTPDGSAPPPPGPPPPPGMEVRPYEPPTSLPPPGEARPAPNRAVQVLLRRADDQQREGDLTGATASIERALRISPRDPLLWHRLAQLRELQGRYGQAEELAAKSNTLASAYDAQLVKSNWRLIARVRRAVGDLAGARAAEARAR